MDTPTPDAHVAGEASPDLHPAPGPTTPAADGRPIGCFGRMAAAAVLVVSGAYLVNPGFGFLEFLPDNLPVVGNLDEAFFTLAFVSALGALGIRLPFLRRR